MTLALLTDALARLFRFRGRGLAFLGLLVVYLVLCVLIGFWAGRVAQKKGRQFSLYMAIGTVVSLCGLLPGLVVVIVAYAQGPAGPPGVVPIAPGAPGPGQYTPQPPPPPPGAGPPPPPPSASPGGQVRQSPDGGYEYTPRPPGQRK